MVRNTDGNDGLIKKLLGENITNETITRIVGDFIIAAGDTVYILDKSIKFPHIFKGPKKAHD